MGTMKIHTFRSDRAQMFLIGAILLALVMLVLATVLTHAIATSVVINSTTPFEPNAEDYTHEVEIEGGEMLGVTNTKYEDDQYSKLDSNFEELLRSWSKTKRFQAAGRGVHIDATVTGTNHGTAIKQDIDGQFTDANGDTSWTLVEDTTHVRDYSMTVDSEYLAEYDGDDEDVFEGLHEDDVFRVVVSADGEFEWWVVYIYTKSDSDNIFIRAQDTLDQPTSGCEIETGDDTKAEISLTTGLVEGSEECPQIRFFNNIPQPMSIHYIDAHNGYGTYSMVVSKPKPDIDSSNYGSSGSDDPYISRALYSADIDVVYSSDRDALTTTVRVAPGEVTYDG